MRACEKEEANVKLLLENGAISTINEKDIKGNFALLYASFLGNFRIVKLLLENGAISTINEKNIDGETALFKAAKNGYTKTVKLLLENGALVNEKNNNGETAINSATKSMKFVSFTKKSLFKQTIELLLEYEAAAQCK